MHRIEPGASLESLVFWELKQDLAQIRYGDDIVLDIGWGPEFKAEGRFRIVVVNQHDWSAPFLDRETADIGELVRLIDTAVDIAASAVKSA